MTGNSYFVPTRPRELGPGRNFNHLSCASTGPKKCQTKNPPADEQAAEITSGSLTANVVMLA
jgi:hypothetical protein